MTTSSNSTTKRAAYLVQRDARTRYSFGPVWTEAVKAGTVTDKDKLVAHGIKLKIGAAGSLSRLRLETLIGKLQAALSK